MERSDYLPVARLQELAAQVDPKIRLEPDAEQVSSERGAVHLEIGESNNLAGHRVAGRAATTDDRATRATRRAPLPARPPWALLPGACGARLVRRDRSPQADTGKSAALANPDLLYTYSPFVVAIRSSKPISSRAARLVYTSTSNTGANCSCTSPLNSQEL